MLYCMHVRLCMLNVSVEASRFKKAVIYLFSYLGELNVTLCCFGLNALNGLFSTKKIKLRSNCLLIIIVEFSTIYALYSCCINGRCVIRRPHPQGSSLLYASSTFIENMIPRQLIIEHALLGYHIIFRIKRLG